MKLSEPESNSQQLEPMIEVAVIGRDGFGSVIGPAVGAPALEGNRNLTYSRTLDRLPDMLLSTPCVRGDSRARATTFRSRYGETVR